MIQPPYTTGTASVTAGSAVVKGTTTAWALGLVSGGLFTRQGLAVPITSVENNTSLTLAYAWPGATGEGAYAIDLGRAQAASAIVANRRLADVISGLAVISPFGEQVVSQLTPAAVRGLIEAQAALGYTPVRQGGGPGQQGNRVDIGWNTTALLASVDGSSMGRLWTDHLASQTLGQNGHIVLPSGIVIQWGASVRDVVAYTHAFPFAFPNACLVAVGSVSQPSFPDNYLYMASVDNFTRTFVSFRKRVVIGNPAAVQPSSDGFPIRYIAIGH